MQRSRTVKTSEDFDKVVDPYLKRTGQSFSTYVKEVVTKDLKSKKEWPKQK